MNNSALFSQRMREARTKKGWSQAELARHAGITPAAVNQFENGPRKPSLPILQSLASALEVSMDYLAGNTEQSNEFQVQSEWQEFYRGFSDLSEKDRELLKAQMEILKKKAESDA